MPLLILLWLPVWAHAAPLPQDGGNQAGLVVVQSDGRVITRCITFSEPQISGLDLLQRSGISFLQAAGPLGAAVCTLNGEGCPANDCFCQCKSNPCVYWRYFHANPDGSWLYSGIGANAWQVLPGGIDAWVWGDEVSGPPALTLADICAAGNNPPAPEPTAQMSPTDAPVPAETPTPTVQPTPTMQPEATQIVRTSPAATKASATPPVTHTPIPTDTRAPVATETVQPAATRTPIPEEAASDAPSRAIGDYVIFGALLLIVVVLGWFIRRK